MTAEKEALHFPLQFRQGGIQCFAPRIDDDGPLRVQPFEVVADGLADPPLDTVAHHGFAKGAGHGKPDPRTVCFGRMEKESGEERPGVPGPFIIDLAKIFRSQQTRTFRKT